jgi:hypothetical protein
LFLLGVLHFMTIRFVPAHHRKPSAAVVVRTSYEATAWATNDNGITAANDTAALGEALRHFSSHGMGAAQSAADKARWYSVCRVLDRRLAQTLLGMAACDD